MKTINVYSTDRNGYEGLSNMLNGPVKINLHEPLDACVTFRTVEHAFHCHKAMFAEDVGACEKIHLAPTGWDAQRLSKTIKGLDSKKWDEKSSAILEMCMRMAFMQNESARNLLISTGDATLTHIKGSINLGKWAIEFPRILMKIREDFKIVYARSKDIPLQ